MAYGISKAIGVPHVGDLSAVRSVQICEGPVGSSVLKEVTRGSDQIPKGARERH